MKNVIEKTILPLIVAIAVLFTVGISAFAGTDAVYVSESEGNSELVSEVESEETIEFDESKFADVNNDGKVNAYDARLLLRCSAELEKETAYILTYGDYNNDGKITAADARTALRVAASVESLECILHGHVFESYTVAPDCVNEGYTTNKCAECHIEDGSRTDIVPALGHKLETSKIEATCTASGRLTVKCTVCGHIDTDREDGKALGHSFSDWVESKDSKTRKCKRCNYSESVKIEKKSDKVVYLTFDDGPGPYTEKLLNYLRSYGVKATFFVTNQNPNYIKLLKTMADDGHAIGVHTLTHQWNIYSSESAYLKDFNAMHDIIKEQTGIDTKIFRFPGGTSNTVSRSYCRGIMTKLSKTMTNAGYYYFDWNVDCYDTSGYSSSEIARTTINQIKGKSVSIVLMHDIKKATVEAIPTIIEYGLANGYSFEVLDENSPAIRFNPAN